MLTPMIVVMYLTVHNPDTGELLYERTRQMPQFSITGDLMEECREQGVISARLIANQFRHKYPNAFANVACKWERETDPT